MDTGTKNEQSIISVMIRNDRHEQGGKMLTWKYCGSIPIRAETFYWRGDLGAVEGMFFIEDYQVKKWSLTSRVPSMIFNRAERFDTAEDAKVKAEKLLADWLDKTGLQVREEK